MQQFNPLEAQLSDLGINSIDNFSHRRSSVGAGPISVSRDISRQYASPQKMRTTMQSLNQVGPQVQGGDDYVNGVRLSFMEKKLLERSHFRNLEKTLKKAKVKLPMPQSPAIGRISRKFNPFESAQGNNMFSQRSASVGQAYPNYGEMPQ